MAMLIQIVFANMVTELRWVFGEGYQTKEVRSTDSWKVMNCDGTSFVPYSRGKPSPPNGLAN